jgi:hypothetical protein
VTWQIFQDRELVSAIVTWLGWTNSSMNPVIYACCSHEFRRYVYLHLSSRLDKSANFLALRVLVADSWSYI